MAASRSTLHPNPISIIVTAVTFITVTIQTVHIINIIHIISIALFFDYDFSSYSSSSTISIIMYHHFSKGLLVVVVAAFVHLRSLQCAAWHSLASIKGLSEPPRCLLYRALEPLRAHIVVTWGGWGRA